MIFHSIANITDTGERSFFFELIQTYCRIVELICEQKQLNMIHINSDDLVIDEYIKIGVVDEKTEIADLKIALGTDYDKFRDSVFFAIQHSEAIGNSLDKLSNKKRRECQKDFNNRKNRLVDFFCGAGGLSLGFIQAGFNVVLANDIEDVCINTYRYNHPEVPGDKIIKGDIKAIIDRIDEYIDNEVDIVVGGPPCQGFSEANRQRVIDDPRNKLYKFFLLAVEKICPKFVVMENVKGMLKVADQVVEDYERIEIEKGCMRYKYKVYYDVLHSQDFSVAQNRERLIYIAIRNDVAEDKSITPQYLFQLIKSSNLGKPIYNLEDALRDIKPLEAPRIKNCNEIDDDLTGKKIDLNHYKCNTPYIQLINCGRHIPLVFNHKARYCSDINYEIYKRLNQGDDATDEKIKDIMPYAHRNHCFKDKYFKLYADRPCRTITAHLRMDCHSHIHPYQVRSITPREAARVQSFPDDYFFMGAYLKTYMQIGNAVPPLMARGIATTLKMFM